MKTSDKKFGSAVEKSVNSDELQEANLTWLRQSASSLPQNLF